MGRLPPWGRSEGADTGRRNRVRGQWRWSARAGRGDGEERWRPETQGEVYSWPVVAGGTVYVGSKDDFLYAIHP
ncbi:PQQ-binding-like beta-propeller repeat protein [Streptomyces sp. MBT65]|uniref:PQQ-binding-like beta-propeller repeat protein n=1 Tax=Streptomyces sp. MBT65 TaxID=1488395 RepID=UPI00190CB679|nr:PQQ-binding-like beta-propeller repeat protein [Streptomyces sp. MBT65]